nr:VF530 family protein [Chromobacterium sp. ASV5]
MPAQQPNNPTHGVTLETMLRELEAHYGWPELGRRIAIRCFTHDPSIKSSLTFLRRTPWARAQVEALFVQLKQGGGQQGDARPRLFGKKPAA